MTGPVGVIHDIGYQRYQGPRLGRRYLVRSLYTHSLRTGYGLGRSAKAKIFPWLVAGMIGSVAVVVTAVRAAVGEQVMTYLDFPEAVFVLVVLFGAVVAPELVSRDLRSGVLPLYFSRPLRRTDYAWAKAAALVSGLWLLLAGPMLVMFLGGVFSVEGWDAIREEIGDFAGGLAYAAVHALLVGAIAILISSMVGRRAVAAGAIVAAFLITTPVVGLLSSVDHQTANRVAGVFSPSTLVIGVREWVFRSPGGVDIGGYGPLYGGVTLGLVVVCVGLLLVRYRKVRA
jgi:ABC-2 type transport system permease protein